MRACFVSVLGTDEERDDRSRGFSARTASCRPRLRGLTHMKRTPELKFVYDETVEKGMRINELLEEEATRE